MLQLSDVQLQTVLDHYSVGRIVSAQHLPEAFLEGSPSIQLSRTIVETLHGLFLVVYAPNDEMHSLWWGSNPEVFAQTLSKACKLINAKLLFTKEDTNTVHKFDLRIIVFAL